MRGYKTVILLFLSGVTVNFAFAPFNIIVIPFVSISYLLFAIYHCKNLKQSFLAGWVFGLGFMGTGLYWFSNALLTDPDNFKWLIPFAVILIPAILAIYYGICCAIAYLFKRTNKLLFVASFACIWTLLEIARTYLFTGFPWLLLGYTYSSVNYIAQLAAIFGIFGLSFLSVLTFSAPFVIYKNRVFSTYVFIAVLLAANVTSFVFGYNRLSTHKEHWFVDKFRIVQPNIHKFHNWTSLEQKQHVDELIALSKQDLPNEIKYIVWPESPVPLDLFNPQIISYIFQSLPKDIVLIANSIRVDFTRRQIFNSAVILKNAELLGYYDKSHLVPFGEYIPFSNVLPMEKITNGAIDFSHGRGVQTHRMNNIGISFLICYESFFPNQVINKTDRPDLLINLTNDAWYGKSPGPYQHFEMTRVRSIEEGLPLVRAANNGISAFIDPYGRVLASLQLNERGFTDANIPQPLLNKTFFSEKGYMTFLLLTIIMILIIITNLIVLTLWHPPHK